MPSKYFWCRSHRSVETSAFDTACRRVGPLNDRYEALAVGEALNERPSFTINELDALSWLLANAVEPLHDPAGKIRDRLRREMSWGFSAADVVFTSLKVKKIIDYEAAPGRGTTSLVLLTSPKVIREWLTP